jgi:ERI1 exoribonuclease 3
MSIYLCVLDFEATCWANEKKSTQEIIEFPSVLYELASNNKVRWIGEFSKYVRPVLEPVLSDFCTELTGITQEQVDLAEPIEVVYEQHFQWLRKNVPTDKMNQVYIVTCGAWDLKTMLPIEIKNKKLPYYDVYKKFINVKSEFEYKYKIKASGMPNMLNKLNLTLDGRHHSGFDDTKNISKILLKMISDGHINFQIVYIK